MASIKVCYGRSLGTLYLTPPICCSLGTRSRGELKLRKRIWGLFSAAASGTKSLM